MDDAPPDQRVDDQLAAMIQARDEGLIGGVGLSNITLEHLLRALERTHLVCVQNPLNLANRASMPVLDECNSRGLPSCRSSRWIPASLEPIRCWATSTCSAERETTIAP